MNLAQPSTDAMNQAFRSGTDNMGCRRRVLARMIEQSRSQPLMKSCTVCGMPLLLTEPDAWDCSFGKRQHFPWMRLPPEMNDLLVSPGFGNLSRIINSMFAMCVLSADKGEGFSLHVGGGAPMMRVNGQLYSMISRRMEHCWFFVDSSFDPYFKKMTKKELSFARAFRDILRAYNSRVSQSISTFTHPDDEETFPFPELPSHTEILGSLYVCAPDNVVSIVYVGPSGIPPPRAMHVIGSNQRIDELHPLWEVLMYPVYHPTGDVQCTWKEGMRPLNSTHRSDVQHGTSRSPKGLTMLDYLRSVMLNEPNFWRTPRLAQQFVLDMWSRNETHNMKYWRSETCQRQIRQYIHLTRGPGAVDLKKIYLPSKVPGSFAYQRTFFHDALHLTSMDGNPHLFLTFTANPHWPEITALANNRRAFDAAIATDRLDCIARVFIHRLKHLKQLLNTKDFLFDGHLGVLWMVGVTEWQQGGLPHVHMAIRLRIDTQKRPMNTLHDQLTLMDELISARTPDKDDAHYDLVMAYMQHGDPCKHCVVKRRDGTTGCRFYFPKKASNTTGVDRKGYAIYRRGEQDTRIVPHIPSLLIAMQCHVNVEYTLFSGCIAYLYKYFVKGASSSAIKLDTNSEFGGVDEIAAFRRARIMCASEAVYRAFGFNINFRKPSVIVCRIHLPRRANGHTTGTTGTHLAEPENNDVLLHAEDAHDFEFRDSDDEIDDAPEQAHTEHDDEADVAEFSRNVLTEQNETFLDMYFGRPEDEECQCLLFTEFFAQFQRTGKRRTSRVRNPLFIDIHGRNWIRRTKMIRARIPFISVKHRELYALRLLLLQFPATSFSDLMGSHSTFRERALIEGLIISDAENVYVLLDAVQNNCSSSECRRLMCLIMSHCSDVHQVWQNDVIRAHISYDFLPSEVAGHVDWPQDVTLDLCLMDISLIMISMGSNDVDLQFHGLPSAPTTNKRMREILGFLPSREFPVFLDYSKRIGFRVDTMRKEQDFMAEVNMYRAHATLSVVNGDMAPHQAPLNADQAKAFAYIKHSIDDRASFLIHIDGSAGCGKTFWANHVANYCRNIGRIVLCVATTGIAALHFLYGRTAHSMFTIPIDMLKDIIEGPLLESSLLADVRNGKNSNRIQLIRSADIIFWDEISMLSKHVFLAVDVLCREVMGVDVPFGGKAIVTLGDWKQISPVDNESEVRALDPEMVANSTSSFRLSVLSEPLWTKFHSIRFDERFNERQKHDQELHTFLQGVGIGQKSQIPVSEFPSSIRFTHSIPEALTFLFYAPSVSIPDGPPHFSASPLPHETPSRMSASLAALYAEKDKLLDWQRGQHPPQGDETGDVHMRLEELHQRLIPQAEQADRENYVNHGANDFASVDDPFTFPFILPDHIHVPAAIHAPFDARFIHRCAFLSPYNNDVDLINAECTRLIQVSDPQTVFHRLRSADSYQQGDLPPAQPIHKSDENHVIDDLELEYARDQNDIQGIDDSAQFDDPLRFDYAHGLTNERLDQETFSVEHLNSQRPPGCPSHSLILCVGMVVMMIRNLDASRHMLNGKRFVITYIHENKRLIFVTPAEKYGIPESPVYLIPRILFKGRISRSQDAYLLRKQFPLRPCYAITIHKSQASTLDRVVVDLRQGIFDHGQLYVALSRVRKGSDLIILIRPDQTHVRNIVHQILLGLGWF